jgi:hypothetical protein
MSDVATDRQDDAMQRVGAQLRQAARVLGLAYAVTLGVVLAAAIGARALDRPLSHVTHDPLAVAKEPFYVGALSNLGVLVWWTVAVACLLAAIVLRHERRDLAQPLAAAGVLSAVLALDDLFMGHDVILPDKLGVPEPVTYAAYAVIGVAFLWIFRAFLRRTPLLLLGVAALFFAASTGIDLGTEGDEEERLAAIEDVLKLFGIVTWGVYWLRLAGGALVRPRHEPRV